MPKDTNTSSDIAPGEIAIPSPTSMQGSFSPKVIHCIMTIYYGPNSEDPNKRDIEFRYSNIYTDVTAFEAQLVSPFNVALFGQQIANRVDFSKLDPLADYPGQGPLDIDVTQDCYVFIQLDSQLNWYFRNREDTNERGITTKFDCGNTYFNLVQLIDPDGKSRTLYFGAKLRPPNGYDGNGDPIPFDDLFNLHLMFERDGATLEVKIDPDIRNPGGNSLEGEGG